MLLVDRFDRNNREIDLDPRRTGDETKLKHGERGGGRTEVTEVEPAATQARDAYSTRTT